MGQGQRSHGSRSRVTCIICRQMPPGALRTHTNTLPTVCPVQVSGYLMEDYSVDTQHFSKIRYLAYWLSYIQFIDWILEMDKL